MGPLSDHMPATSPATQDARKPSEIPSDAPAYAGEGGVPVASPGDISQSNSGGVSWEAMNDNKPGWDVGSDEQKGPQWEVSDRKDENDEGGLPQRQP